MTTKHVCVSWLAGAVVSAVLTFGKRTVWSMMAPTDLLRWGIFWPLLALEFLGKSACVHGCSGLTFFLAEDLDALFTFPLLDLLTFLIVCTAAAWLIVRLRRRRPGRMLR